MNVLDLFSGIGGFSLGLERAGMKTVAFCEINAFCRKVLGRHWPEVPIYEDIRTIREQFTGTVELICGGYPCQPFSHAGKREGADDDRHLWPEMLACIRHYRPRWVIGENVAGHISMGLDDVLADLEGEGYTARAFIIPACALNAPHRRDRIWIVAHRNGIVVHASRGERTHEQSGNGEIRRGIEPVPASEVVAYASGAGRQEQHASSQPEGPGQCSGGADSHWGGWESEPAVGRVADGVPYRVDRLKALGNAVVPQIPEMLGRAIMAADGGHA